MCWILAVASLLSQAVGAQGLDTVVVLGTVERDLTGDDRPELLRLVGEGASIDSLAVTFTIESSGTVVFRTALAPLTRTVGFDAGRRELTAAEHRALLDHYGDRFLAEDKFKPPAAFVAWLRQLGPRHVALIPAVIDRERRGAAVVDSLTEAGLTRTEAERLAPIHLGSPGARPDTARAASIWTEMQRTGVTVFTFSPGGDIVTAIAWSERDRRFYRLLQCC